MLEVNQNRMRALMRDFHTLTHIRMVLFDDQMREIMAYPDVPCAFCREMRKDEKFRARCVACDRTAFSASRKTDEPIIYACHAGLTEAVMRIRADGATAGYVMFGQVIPRESADATRARLTLQNTALVPAIDNMPEKNMTEVRAAATILDALSVYLWSNRVVGAPGGDFVRMLDDYVDRHIAEKICAEDICRFFGIGRTKLYRLAAERLGRGIADYVRDRRVVHARHLLAETDLSVSAIATAAGFSEYNYFSRVFRDATGMTPRECRAPGFIHE